MIWCENSVCLAIPSAFWARKMQWFQLRIIIMFWKKGITKKYILRRQYEYSGKSLRGRTAHGTGAFVRTTDDFDISQEETYGSTTDIYLTLQIEDHSLFPKCHFVEVVPPPRLGNFRTARKSLKKTYTYFFYVKFKLCIIYWNVPSLYSLIYEFRTSISNI